MREKTLNKVVEKLLLGGASEIYLKIEEGEICDEVKICPIRKTDLSTYMWFNGVSLTDILELEKNFSKNKMCVVGIDEEGLQILLYP